MARAKANPAAPASRGRRTADETREHLLAVAGQLFYWHGIRSTGVDRVASEAAVAPAQIYRLFRSKDELVAAYVERNDEGYRHWVDASLAEGGDAPRERLLALFDALAIQVRPEVCRGCPFLMTLAEYPDADHPAHRHAVATKAWVRARLHAQVLDLLGSAGRAPDRPGGAGADAEQLADALVLIMEGVYASVQALGHDGPAQRARALVERLLPDATP